MTVSHAGRTFRITLDAVVHAPPRRVYEVMANYARLGKLNPAITSIRVRAAPDGDGERVRSVLNARVWFFCRRIVQVEDVTEPDRHTILRASCRGRGSSKAAPASGA